ncbi:MAG: helix-turn-helix domain-containing protein, partial [Candidatus Cloacimonetes bacterium]|nr:helix-turn-helix domain-containing protein [Candidatus Cloacimonadota bacterium]
MKNFYKSLGKRIKKLRDEADLSQEKFSQRLKMSRVSISQIENGV